MIERREHSDEMASERAGRLRDHLVMRLWLLPGCIREHWRKRLAALRTGQRVRGAFLGRSGNVARVRPVRVALRHLHLGIPLRRTPRRVGRRAVGGRAH